MKERLKKEYTMKLRMVLKSELNTKNKMMAIGALAIPVLRYSFVIMNEKIQEMQKLLET
jgi:hypothetical protein